MTAEPSEQEAHLPAHKRGALGAFNTRYGWPILKDSVTSWLRHEGMRLAASLSLYILLSLVPLLILTTAMREQPWATPILLAALGVAFAAIFGRVQPMVFGETTVRRLPHAPALLPVFAHLAIVLVLGLYVPPYLADWYRAAARLIGGP